MSTVMQRYHVDERQAGAVIEMMKKLPQIQKEMASKAQTEGRRIAEHSNLNQNLSMQAIKTKMEKKMENTFAEPLRKVGADIGHGISEYVDNFLDGLMERHALQITKATSGQVIGAMSGNSQALAGLMTDVRGAGGSTDRRASHSFMDNALSLATDYNTERKNQYDFLHDLPRSLTSSRANTFSQTEAEVTGTKKLLNDAQRGIFSKGAIKEIHDSINNSAWKGMSAEDHVGEKEKQLQAYLRNNNYKLSKMNQTDRLNAIRQETGLSPQAIAYLQRSSGTNNLLGSLDVSALAGERYGTANLGNAEELANAVTGATNGLAGAFENKGVKALLNTDNSARGLFLGAVGGNADALALLNNKMSDAQRDKLMDKFGVKAGDLESVRELYSSRKHGVDDSSLAKLGTNWDVAVRRGSAGAAITQLRRQGMDMDKRLAGADANMKGILSGLVGGLSSLDGANPEAVERTLKSMDGTIGSTLDSISGMSDARRKQALGILGPGAKAAMDYGNRVERQVHQRGGLGRFLEGADDETKAYVAKLREDGNFSDTDAKKLNKFVRDRTFKGSLAQDGSVSGKEVPGATNLTQQITTLAQNNRETAQINKEFAQITTKWAQTVIDGGKGDPSGPGEMRGATAQMNGPKENGR
jgi:hypothetical protein